MWISVFGKFNNPMWKAIQNKYIKWDNLQTDKVTSRSIYWKVSKLLIAPIINHETRHGHWMIQTKKAACGRNEKFNIWLYCEFYTQHSQKDNARVISQPNLIGAAVDSSSWIHCHRKSHWIYLDKKKKKTDVQDVSNM
jgi:hypothetical protein